MSKLSGSGSYVVVDLQSRAPADGARETLWLCERKAKECLEMPRYVGAAQLTY